MYQAIIIHPEATGGRTSGKLTINAMGVLFESESISHSINLNVLSITAGGASNRFVFFVNKNQDDISIYTSDRSVLKNTYLTSNPNFTKSIKKSKSILKKTLYGSLLVLSVFLLFIAGGYFLKDKMVEHLANQIPQSWEKSAGDKLFTTLSLQYHFIQNDSLKKEFLRVARPLFKQIEKEGYTIDLYFVKDGSINAFALPGGRVIIQTGLIENAKSWEEVMGVLSHELSHVTRRHHIRGVLNNLGIYAILSATIGDVSALAGTIVNLGGDLASLSNSRDFEYEADEKGWDYLHNADINPSGLISFFETLKKENKTKIDATLEKVDLSFLSTHPDTQARIDILKIKNKNNPHKYNALPNTFNEFKKALLKIN